MTRVLSSFIWGVMAILAVLVAVMSARFFVLPLELAAPPPLLEAATSRTTIFMLHVAGGIIALVIGTWNILERPRNLWLTLHRWLGRIYLVSVFGGGLAGFALAFTAQGGLTGRIGFGMLAVLWLATAVVAYVRIRPVRLPSWIGGVPAVSAGGVVDRSPDIQSHRRWMIRNYALTFAAVTLRLWLPALGAAGYSFPEAYPAVAWLCWVPNLLVAEIVANRVGRLRKI
jgi:hypothetical protein